MPGSHDLGYLLQACNASESWPLFSGILQCRGRHNDVRMKGHRRAGSLGCEANNLHHEGLAPSNPWPANELERKKSYLLKGITGCARRSTPTKMRCQGSITARRWPMAGCCSPRDSCPLTPTGRLSAITLWIRHARCSSISETSSRPPEAVSIMS